MINLIVIVKIIAVFGIISCSDDELERISLDDYPLAQCNDLTTAVYYRHPNVNQQSSKKMLIYLQGGGFCVPGDGPTNCNARCANGNQLCTARTNPTYKFKANGLGATIASKNSTLNPAFHDFSNVYVPYCSSDLHSGTADASAETEGRAFHGKNIIKAIINDLMTNTWLAEADEVVLAGSSAGGFGVERNCDWMADQLKAGKPDMKIKCIIDSGSLVPMETFFEYCFENNIENNEGRLYWKAELDESCLNESPDPEVECAGLTTSYPYLETSSMVVMSATDTLYTHTCNHRDEEVFLQSWRDELAQLARNMTSTKPGFGFFLENCSFHTVLGRAEKYHYQQVPVDDGPEPGRKLTPRELVNNFWNQNPPFVGIDNMDVLNPQC